MSATSFVINAKPSFIHRGYLAGLCALSWLPAGLWLDDGRLLWFLPGWLLLSVLCWRGAARYRLQGEYRDGILRINGRSGQLSAYSRAGPGFLVLVLKGDPWPPFWLFSDSVPDELYRRLSQRVLLAT